MLLILIMPSDDRAVLECSVHRWLKAEGDALDYGDDICEVKVEKRRMVSMTYHPSQVIKQIASPKSTAVNRWTDGNTRIRITASDTGILRKIRLKSGERVAAGDVMAILSTDENDPLPDAKLEAREMVEFRTVSNRV